jgi:triacylglycerol lipase
VQIAAAGGARASSACPGGGQLLPAILAGGRPARRLGGLLRARYPRRVSAPPSVAVDGLSTLAWAWPWLAGGAAVLAIGVAALWLRARRRLRPRRRLRRAPRHPVVLAHGLLGFDALRVAGARADYFRGVSERLVREGCVVHRCRVAPTASIAARARDLAVFVSGLDARRVNVVAHSMGGLDARWAISRLGLRDRVASLVTIGTPHRGTPLADAGASLAARAGLFAALRRVGLDLAAFHDLTTARMAAFDAEAPDARGVRYACVVGAPGRKRDVSPILVPTFAWLRAAAGENDGMVPADSQRRGEVLRVVPADHFAQIGWSRRFDALELYAEIVSALRGEGL